MLVSLSVQNILLIERLDLDLKTGLTAFTGETGAGKSIILDALELALGGRGDKALVRNGAEKGFVTATFVPPAQHGAWEILKAHDIPFEEEIILKRMQPLEGTGKAFINDHVVGIALLKKIGTSLLEIHGQHAERVFIAPDHHRLLLDLFARLEPEAHAVSFAYHKLKEKEALLEKKRKQSEEIASERAFLENALQEIEEFQPQVGEEEELSKNRHFLMGAEQFKTALQEAEEVIQDGLRSRLVSALRKLERKREADQDIFDPVCIGFERVLEELSSLEEAFQKTQEAIRFNPLELERLEERLFALRGMAKKYHVLPDELCTLSKHYREKIETFSEEENHVQSLDREVKDLREVYKKAAAHLSEKRCFWAHILEEEVNTELSFLRLFKASFKTSIETDHSIVSAHGFDRVSFLISTNASVTFSDLEKIASGGELSRIMLALKVVLAKKMAFPTLIFDEIDKGMSGAISDLIGQRLAVLGKSLQVLVITHSPQVASRAEYHFLISKEEKNEKTSHGPVVTRIFALDENERCEEIARMLSGAYVTEEARAQAKHLLRREEKAD